MKSSISIPIVFMAGAVMGTLYGWQSGYKDGAVSSSLPITSFLTSYGALRGSEDVYNRDRLVDLQVIDAANVFAKGHSHSPLFHVMHPKSDEGLLHVAAYWELNYEKPSVWRKNFYPVLFDPGSPEEEYLKELKIRKAEEYDAILEEHRRKREKQPKEEKS